MEILTQLLNDNPDNVFLPKHFTRLPYSLPNAASKFTHFLNWDVVKAVIDEQKSVLRVVKDGIVTRDYTDIKYQKALDYYKQGNTLLLRYAEKSHPLLKILAEDFSKSFRTEVDIQLYCTPADNNAFGWHYDVEEVFILQTKGSKRYTIRSNTIHPRPLLSSIPKNLDFEKENSDIFLDVLLVEGDWLYIPSGWWHIARTQSESMHISIGLMPRSAIDVLEFLPHYMRNHSYWRSRLPVHKIFKDEKTEIEYYREAMVKLGEDLSTHLGESEFIKNFMAFIKNRTLL